VLDAHGESEALWPGNDALCAALQIINHLQDCGKDYRDIDRVYIPLDMLAEEGLGVDALTGKASSPGLTRCLARLVKSCDELLDQSEGFAGAIVDARLGCEVAAIQRLARRLCAILATSDPLRDKVHLSKFQALATAGAAVAGEGLARLGGSRRRAVRNADAA
jgi:phytoene/squalene synthetase